jgi:AcrR family transcriptional regulator
MSDPTSALTRRERHAADRLEHILDAAARLFAERGFHRTKTRDIAEAADVAEGTLYNYFENKNDLLFGILARLERQTAEASLGNVVESDDPAEARRSFVEAMIIRREFNARNAVMLQAILSEILSNDALRRRYMEQVLGPMLDTLEKNMQRREDLGQVRDVDIPALARLLGSLWIGMLVMQALDEPMITNEWERVVDALTDALFVGIGK